MKRRLWLCIIIYLHSSLLFGFEDAKPVTPKASPQAKALLKFFYSISGNYILTGQHNFPNVKSRNSEFAAKYTGKTPVIFSTDWGFAKEGDIDSYRARPAIVEEIKRQHCLGSIIMICWHAVPPTADEPVTFRPLPGKNLPDFLASIQGQLLDERFKEILTPGTKLYKHWCSQIDTIAFYLKQLQDANIPVIWRPYHEMNGNWFWWGGRRGEFGTIALYRQMFNRLVKYHKLNNLIWLWSVDRPVKPEMRFSDYYPGNDYFDAISLDVYRNDFNQSYYDSLVILSKGKPLMLAEVGNPPSLDILKSQPKWTSYAVWSGMVRNTLKKQYKDLMTDSHILGIEDTVYRKTIAEYRRVCGLPLFPIYETKPDSAKLDFSGEWIFNEEKSNLDNFGVNNIPYKMKIIQNDTQLAIQRSLILEYADDKIIDDTLIVNGVERKSEIFNSPRFVRSRWSEKNDTLINESKVLLGSGGQASEMVINEYWTLQDHGSILSIRQLSRSPWGERKITVIFERK